MDFGRCRIIEPWPDWESSIHTDDAQILRQGWAMTYQFHFKINKKAKTARFSSTSELPYYRTTLFDCNCGDFEYRKLPCKHIYRLAVELGIITIIKRLPRGHNKDEIAEIKESQNKDAHPEQLKRQKSGMDKKCVPVEVDYEKKTAVFSGSDKKPYATTIDSCTCRDYYIRRLPCKHI